MLSCCQVIKSEVNDPWRPGLCSGVLRHRSRNKRLESAGVLLQHQEGVLSEQTAEAQEPVAVQFPYLGTDQGVQLYRKATDRLDGDAVMLNFEQAPLNEVIHTILGDTLGLDYVIENQVPGEITPAHSPIPGHSYYRF